MGFLGAKLRVQSLVPAAILNWSHSEAARAANVPIDFKSGERYLTASTVAAFCAQAQAAAPVQQQVHEAQEHNAVAIVVPAEATTQQSANRRHLPAVYTAGTLHLRRPGSGTDASKGHSDSATPTTPSPKRDIRYFVNKAIAAAPAGSSARAQPTRSRPNTWM
jgi:hypothetical protein